MIQEGLNEYQAVAPDPRERRFAPRPGESKSNRVRSTLFTLLPVLTYSLYRDGQTPENRIPGAFYHITARGNEQKDLFRDDNDRERFLGYLETAAGRYKAVIHVYCLMSNHFHLLLSTPEGNLSQIMRHINGGYTTWFNKRHNRFGHLFQGRYKAILVDADPYAGELSRYIHLNPVRADMVGQPEEYPWSSYRAYTGKTKPPRWLTTDWLLRYFGQKPATAKKAYTFFVKAVLEKTKTTLKGGGIHPDTGEVGIHRRYTGEIP